MRAIHIFAARFCNGTVNGSCYLLQVFIGRNRDSAGIPWAIFAACAAALDDRYFIFMYTQKAYQGTTTGTRTDFS